MKKEISMIKTAILALEDGSIFNGFSYGSANSVSGEVVFNTSMAGYQEILTDPSYAGQIVVLTYPLIGNYGINISDFESSKIQVAGFVVKEHCSYPSSSNPISSFDNFLTEQKITGIMGLDTRALTKKIRTHGAMKGIISTNKSADQILLNLKKSPNYNEINFVENVTTNNSFVWNQNLNRPEYSDFFKNELGKHKIIVLDYGLKYNILRILEDLNCTTLTMPENTSFKDILDLKPDGVLLSPGPGDPDLLTRPVENVKKLIGQVPIMGICLGNQIIAKAFGGKTYKLKFGHHGANHPVKKLSSGEVYITSQNHGYSVDADSLPAGLEVSYLNLNDNTVEGLTHTSLPVLSVQYHSEGAPGPQENSYIFNEFLNLINSYNKETNNYKFSNK